MPTSQTAWQNLSNVGEKWRGLVQIGSWPREFTRRDLTRRWEQTWRKMCLYFAWQTAYVLRELGRFLRMQKEIEAGVQQSAECVSSPDDADCRVATYQTETRKRKWRSDKLRLCGKKRDRARSNGGPLSLFGKLCQCLDLELWPAARVAKLKNETWCSMADPVGPLRLKNVSKATIFELFRRTSQISTSAPRPSKLWPFSSRIEAQSDFQTSFRCFLSNISSKVRMLHYVEAILCLASTYLYWRAFTVSSLLDFFKVDCRVKSFHHLPFSPFVFLPVQSPTPVAEKDKASQKVISRTWLGKLVPFWRTFPVLSGIAQAYFFLNNPNISIPWRAQYDIGLSLIFCGGLLRVWCYRKLGQAFTFYLKVERGQKVKIEK